MQKLREVSKAALGLGASTRDVLAGRKKDIEPSPHTMLSAKVRAKLDEEFGTEQVESAMVDASAIFLSLDTEDMDGKLTQSEFTKCLGVMGSPNSQLAAFLFDSIDLNHNGTISFQEYLRWMLTIVHGTQAQKLRLGFDLCDSSGDRLISRDEVQGLVQSMFFVMTKMRLETARAKVEAFANEIFERFDTDGSGALTWEEYQAGCLSHTLFLQTLGLSGAPANEATAPNPANSFKGVGTVSSFFGQNNWDFVLSVMLGVELMAADAETAVQAVTAGGAASVDPMALVGDELRTAMFEQSVPGSEVVLPADSACEGLTVRTRYPQTFMAIRDAFGIDEPSFVASLGIRQVLGNLLMGDLCGLSSMVSEGKSGELFFFSHDARYLVKTISTQESRKLETMLPAYIEHICANPDTVLARYLALFDITFHGKKRCLVVMASAFNTRLQVHERFDLKGSTHGRTCGALRGQPNVVHKDLDLITMGKSLHLPKDVAMMLLHVLAEDVAFLRDQGVIDYSLLLGIHNMEHGEEQASSVVLGGGGDGEAGEDDGEDDAMFEHLLEVFRETCEGFEIATGKKVFDTMDKAKFKELALQYSSTEGVTARAGAAGRPAVKVALPAPPAPEHANAFQQYHGGCCSHYTSGGVAVKGQHVFFISIIDLLVPFNARKKSEFALKKIARQGDFSVIPPDAYAVRFMQFMQNIIQSDLEVPVGSTPEEVNTRRISRRATLTSQLSQSEKKKLGVDKKKMMSYQNLLVDREGLQGAHGLQGKGPSLAKQGSKSYMMADGHGNLL